MAAAYGTATRGSGVFFFGTLLKKKKAAGVKLHPPAAGWNQASSPLARVSWPEPDYLTAIVTPAWLLTAEVPLPTVTTKEVVFEAVALVGTVALI